MASRILKNLFVNQFCWGRWVNLWMTVARLVAELLLPQVWCSCHGSSDFGRRLFQLCVATLLQRCQLCCLIGSMCLPRVGFRWVDEWFFSQLIFFFKRKFRQVRFYWAWKEIILKRKAIGRHGVVHFVWIIDHGIVWLPLFCWIFVWGI